MRWHDGKADAVGKDQPQPLTEPLLNPSLAAPRNLRQPNRRFHFLRRFEADCEVFFLVSVSKKKQL